MAIAEVSLVKEWIFAGVEFSIADENKIALFGSLAVADDDWRFRWIERAKPSPNVGEASDPLLQLPGNQLNRARVPTGAGHLQKLTRARFFTHAKPRFGKIDPPFVAGANHFPRL